MTVRSAILQLLDEGDRHGYQLKVDFEARTGGIWPLNVGQVYTTLDRLLRDGLVEQGPQAEAPPAHLPHHRGRSPGGEALARGEPRRHRPAARRS